MSIYYREVQIRNKDKDDTDKLSDTSSKKKDVYLWKWGYCYRVLNDRSSWSPIENTKCINWKKDRDVKEYKWANCQEKFQQKSTMDKHKCVEEDKGIVV